MVGGRLRVWMRVEDGGEDEGEGGGGGAGEGEGEGER